MRPTLATFGTLNPLGSPASKYRLSARLRQLLITSGNVMRQTANVKFRFTDNYARNGTTSAVSSGAPIALAIRADTRSAAATKAASGRRM